MGQGAGGYGYYDSTGAVATAKEMSDKNRQMPRTV